MNLAKIPNCITITSINNKPSLSLSLFAITIIKMGRPPCCDKSNVKRGIWTAEEDAKILAYVSTYGVGNWTLVPKKAGLNRCGKSCRLRWTNYLRPDLKHDGFTPQEEDLIISLHKAIGSRWSLIAKQLPGRTDNDVKNYWNTKLRKKLAKMGIDPVTHKPFSQILSEYGNISGGLPSINNNATRVVVGSLNRGSSMPISELTSLPTTTSSSPMRLDSLITNNNNPWDFQSRFQVINQETMRSAILCNEVTPSSSSSSSCSSSSYTVNQIINSPLPFSCQPSPFRVTPNSPFSWSDFLTGEPAISTDDDMLKKQETLVQCKEVNGVDEHENSCSFNYGLPTGNIHIGEGETNSSHSEASSSSIEKSFVDALLDQDRLIRSEFPQLLNESFEY